MAYGSFILCLFGPSLACFDLLDKWVALDKSEAEWMWYKSQECKEAVWLCVTLGNGNPSCHSLETGTNERTMTGRKQTTNTVKLIDENRWSELLHLNVGLSRSLSVGSELLSFFLFPSSSSRFWPLVSVSSCPCIVSLMTVSLPVDSRRTRVAEAAFCSRASSFACVSVWLSPGSSVLVWSSSFSSARHWSADPTRWLGSDELRERIWCLAVWSLNAHTCDTASKRTYCTQCWHNNPKRWSKTGFFSKGKVA